MATPPPRLHLVHFSVDAADEDRDDDDERTTSERRREWGPARAARCSGATRPPREIHRPGACRSTPSRVWRPRDRATAACAVPRRWRRSWARAPAPRTSSRTRPSARSPTRSCASSRQTRRRRRRSPSRCRRRRWRCAFASRRRSATTTAGGRRGCASSAPGPARRASSSPACSPRDPTPNRARPLVLLTDRDTAALEVIGRNVAFERAGVGEVRAAAAAVGQARRALEGDAKGGG